MADVEAKIIVSVVDKATKALTEINKSVGGLDKLIQNNSKQIRNFGIATTAAGAAITGALGLSVQKFVETGDALQKMSIRTGFSTEALSELRHAAELSDTSLQAMEMGILAMSKTMEGARDGALGVTDSFRKLGLSASDLEGLSPEETFFKLSAAVADVEDPMQRLALASEVFGRAGKEMLPLLASGSAGLNQMREEAHRLGIVFDEDAANAAAKLGDAFTTLGKTTEGISNQIAIALVPVLNNLLTNIQPVIESVVHWMQKNPELVETITLMTAALGIFLTVIGSLSLGLIAVNAALLAVGLTLAAGGALFIALTGIIALVLVITQHWEGLKWMAGQAVDYIIGRLDAFVVKLQALKQQFLDFLTLVKNAASAVGNAIGGGPAPSVMQHATPRAGGGRVSEDLTLVGEQGPELVSLPRGSYVHPAGETSKMMGGVTIGAINVYNEADENRLIDKLTRLIQLQTLAA